MRKMTESATKDTKLIEVDAIGYFSKIIKSGTIIKRLEENQVVCTTCEGTALVLENNGQYISSCQNCFGGVIKLCEYCQSEMSRGTSSLWHGCNEANQERLKRDLKKEKEKYIKAIKI